MSIGKVNANGTLNDGAFYSIQDVDTLIDNLEESGGGSSELPAIPTSPVHHKFLALNYQGGENKYIREDINLVYGVKIVRNQDDTLTATFIPDRYSSLDVATIKQKMQYGFIPYVMAEVYDADGETLLATGVAPLVTINGENLIFQSMDYDSVTELSILTVMFRSSTINSVRANIALIELSNGNQS